MPRKIAIVNSKGGVGKTMTTINLGAYLAASGQKTLLVDADPNLAIIRNFSKAPLFGLEIIDWKQFKRIKRLNCNFILFDCAPGLGRLTKNILKISNQNIIPIKYTLDNLPKGKLLLNMFERKNKLDRQILKNIRRKFEHFNVIIPKSVYLAESYQQGKTILQYAPFSKGARAYRNLARELLSPL